VWSTPQHHMVPVQSLRTSDAFTRAEATQREAWRRSDKDNSP
jgi:hypothetical protein